MGLATARAFTEAGAAVNWQTFRRMRFVLQQKKYYFREYDSAP